MNLTKIHIFLFGFFAIILATCAFGLRLMRTSEQLQFTPSDAAKEGFESPVCNRSQQPKPYGSRKNNTPVCKGCNNSPRFCNCNSTSGSAAGSAAGYAPGSAAGSAAGSVAGSVGAALGIAQPAPIAPCPRTLEPDLSKYILKSQVPSTNTLLPDMTNYMLKTECPPVPDLSKYVLKSSIPKPQPIIIDNSSCKNDVGECPPCPRPRCPEVKCPPPTKCPPPAPCPRPVCPPTVVKCKSEESTPGSTVRPFLAPLSMHTFGMA
jgi:hypothetical protein